MTKITVFKKPNGSIYGFTAKGHADKKSSAGNDIYCAYLSALTQTACNGLEAVAKVNVKTVVSDGYLSARISERDADDIRCRTILDTFALGISSFKEEYPSYLQIFEEVQT